MNAAASWRVAAASAIGTAHVNQNTECQDRLAWRTLFSPRGEILVAAVADGAGSTTDGQRGAELACRLFLDEIADYLAARDASVKSLNRDFGARWIAYFQAEIERLAKREKKLARDYASTLVGAVVGADAAVFYQIGDGGVVFSTSGARASYAFAIEPVEAEYVNVTNFATDETAAEALQFKLIDEPVEDVILFSDGVAAVAVDFAANRPHEPFLMPMIAPLRQAGAAAGLNEKLENFLGSPKLNEKTDDDKTIILASRAAARELAV